MCRHNIQIVCLCPFEISLKAGQGRTENIQCITLRWICRHEYMYVFVWVCLVFYLVYMLYGIWLASICLRGCARVASVLYCWILNLLSNNQKMEAIGNFPQFLLQYFPRRNVLMATLLHRSLSFPIPTNARWKTRKEWEASKQPSKNKTIGRWFAAKTKQWPCEIFHRMVEWTIAKSYSVNWTMLRICVCLYFCEIIANIHILHAIS